MTSYSFPEVVLVYFPQTGTTVPKLRPAVIVLDIGDDDIVVVPLTSVARAAAGDFAVSDWKPAGLNRQSTARLAKLTTLSKQDVARGIGRLSANDASQFAAAWQTLFAFQP